MKKMDQILRIDEVGGKAGLGFAEMMQVMDQGSKKDIDALMKAASDGDTKTYKKIVQKILGVTLHFNESSEMKHQYVFMRIRKIRDQLEMVSNHIQNKDYTLAIGLFTSVSNKIDELKMGISNRLIFKD